MRDKFFKIMETFVNEAPTRTGDRGEHSQSTAETSERSALLRCLRDNWKRALSAANKTKDMRTADREADREQAERKRRFVNECAASRRFPPRRLNA